MHGEKLILGSGSEKIIYKSVRKIGLSKRHELYNKIKLNSKKHHAGRNIATIVNAKVDIFVTNNIKDYPKERLSNLKVLSWNEFVKHLAKKGRC